MTLEKASINHLILAYRIAPASNSHFLFG